MITETNEQYYVGTQANIVTSSFGETDNLVYTFDEVLTMGSSTSWNPTDPDFHLNNFNFKCNDAFHVAHFFKGQN